MNVQLPPPASIDSMLEGFFVGTSKSIALLYSNGLYAHLLVVIYSAIDTMGLLDAPPSQIDATGPGFKSWVRKYLLGDPRVNFNDADLWAARCAVLHTFTSESRLSREGQAKELQYFGGDKESEFAKQFVTITPTLHGGKHVPVHFEDLCEIFFEGIKRFALDLQQNCVADPAYEARLRKILQTHYIPPTPADAAAT